MKTNGEESYDKKYCTSQENRKY